MDKSWSRVYNGVSLSGGIYEGIGERHLAVVVLSAITLVVFAWASYEVMTKFPAARLAPRVGQRVPEFALTDREGATMTLTQALTTPMKDSSGESRPPKGVLLVFYRGYW